jgi:hypothetical protein
VFLFFSVARSQEKGSWERATETAHSSSATANGAVPATKPAVKVAAPKSGFNPNFGMNMPMMVSAFDTAAWLQAAA